MTPGILASFNPQGKGLMSAREWFERSDSGAGGQVMAVLGLLACGVLLVWGVSRLQARLNAPAPARPMRLFRRMQRKIGIPAPDRVRLWLLARASEIRYPAALLISPALFDEAVSRYRESRKALLPIPPARFAAIRARLFPAPR